MRLFFKNDCEPYFFILFFSATPTFRLNTQPLKSRDCSFWNCLEKKKKKKGKKKLITLINDYSRRWRKAAGVRREFVD